MEKLLIVGDLAEDADFARLCTQEGYEVWTSTDRSEVVPQVEGGGVSLVFLCQCLGDRDGVELLEKIRAADPRVEVIFVSCGVSGVELSSDEASRESAVEVLRAGALDYLRQPIGLQRLRVVFDYARRSRRETERDSPARRFVAAQ